MGGLNEGGQRYTLPVRRSVSTGALRGMKVNTAVCHRPRWLRAYLLKVLIPRKQHFFNYRTWWIFVFVCLFWSSQVRDQI